MSPLINEGTDLVSRFGATAGHAVTSAASPLTRLNYFDGKFLRADDLRREQNYFRHLVQFSNQGLGAGVVYGMDTVLDRQGRLSIGAGLAMDSAGRTLLIGDTQTLDIGALIDASRRTSTATPLKRRGPGGAAFRDCVDLAANPSDEPTPAGSLYVICIGHAEALCGTEDVYGQLCEEACVTATDRPLIVEGVVVRALPLTLRTRLATSGVPLDRRHLRSLVASAYFEDERHVVGSLISRAGLSMDTWCVGADLGAVACVPLAVISRAGNTTVFLDAWTVRRERIEAPARRYWAWRMAMRPWDVFLAHVLQFQCQLHEVLGEDPTDPANPGPCVPQQEVLTETARYLQEFDHSYTRHIGGLLRTGEAPPAVLGEDAFRLKGGLADLARLRQRIDGAIKGIIAGPRERVLINGGIVELPAAGYLPVVPGVVSVNEQVRRLLGEGLDLRFCIVRPDFVPHALEEAQHMKRISLLAGLDDPEARPEVDILVPNGDLLTREAPVLAGFDTQVQLTPIGGGVVNPDEHLAVVPRERVPIVVHGAGRPGSTGAAIAFHFAGAQEAETARDIIELVRGVRSFAGATKEKRETILKAALKAALKIDRANPPFTRVDRVPEAVLTRVLERVSPQRGTGPVTERANASARRTPKRAEAAAAGAPAVAAPKPLVGFWVTMRSERDPFELAVAESTPVSVELALTMETTSATGAIDQVLLRVRVAATFSATQLPRELSTGRQMTGHLAGTFVTQAFNDTATDISDGQPFDLEVTLLRTGSDSSGAVRAEFGKRNTPSSFVADLAWGGAPLELTLTVAAFFVRQYIDILRARALASATALAEGGALRRLSTVALDLIGNRLTRATQNGAAFVDASARLLFPPPPPRLDDLTVRGTLDWVLFHRRRTKQCAAAPVEPLPSPPRRYQLLAYHAKSLRDLELLRATLHNSTGQQLNIRPVNVLEFAAGAATLLTAADVLLHDWNAAQPGDRLAYAAIAIVLAEDAPFSQARLERVVKGVAPVSPLESADRLEVLAEMPVALVQPNIDGVVVLATLARVVADRLARVVVLVVQESDRTQAKRRVPLRAGDVIVFKGTVLQQTGTFASIVAELHQHIFQNVDIRRTLVRLELVTRTAPDAEAQERLDVVFNVFIREQPPLTAGGPADVRRVRRATPEEKDIFEEDNQSVADLLVLTIMEARNG